MMERTEQLVQILKQASDRYYNYGDSELSDEEYDKLVDELKELDPNNKFLKTVGAPVVGKTFKHLVPVGSLEKLKTKEEFARWYKTVETSLSPQYVVQKKLDGNSVILEYKNSKLVRIGSRGDGLVGEDISQTAGKIQGIVKTLPIPFTGMVRGEAIISVADYEKYLKPMGYKNPRNAVGGLLRDMKVNDLLKYAKFICYDVHPISTPTEQGKLEFIESFGLETVWTKYCQTPEEVDAIYKEIAEKRESEEFEIDGLVVKTNDTVVQQELGMSSDYRPKWAKCVKFEAQGAVTKLIGITWTQGHTGAMIPTGNLEPVQIGGVTVSNVLLNNCDYIAAKGVAIGDVVYICRRGDVIPYLDHVIEKSTDRQEILPPSDCIACHSLLVKEGVHWVCNNENCAGQELQRLKNWVTKRNIKYLGDELLAELHSKHGVKRPVHLYALTEEYLSQASRGNGIVGTASKQIITEINKSRTATLPEFLGSLGIPALGRRQVEIMMDICSDLNSLEAFLNLTKEKLISLPGFKDSKTNTIVDGVAHFRPVIEELAKVITITTKEKPVMTSEKYAGKVCCFTGVRPKPDEKANFESGGGVIKDSVSKGLTHLIVKDVESQSSKTQKAKSLGIVITSYEEWKRW